MTARPVLLAALLALAALYAAWFGMQGDIVAVLVFALPPLLFAAASWRRWPRAPFWAAVIALAWFSHGVMVAWSRPGERAFAWGAIVLSLAVVFAASLPGLRARLGRRA